MCVFFFSFWQTTKKKQVKTKWDIKVWIISLVSILTSHYSSLLTLENFRNLLLSMLVFSSRLIFILVIIYEQYGMAWTADLFHFTCLPMYIVFYFVLNECDPTVIVANVRDFPRHPVRLSLRIKVEKWAGKNHTNHTTKMMITVTIIKLCWK